MSSLFLWQDAGKRSSLFSSRCATEPMVPGRRYPIVVGPMQGLLIIVPLLQ